MTKLVPFISRLYNRQKASLCVFKVEKFCFKTFLAHTGSVSRKQHGTRGNKVCWGWFLLPLEQRGLQTSDQDNWCSAQHSQLPECQCGGLWTLPVWGERSSLWESGPHCLQSSLQRGDKWVMYITTSYMWGPYSIFSGLYQIQTPKACLLRTYHNPCTQWFPHAQSQVDNTTLTVQTHALPIHFSLKGATWEC